jgi:hypothetical protein
MGIINTVGMMRRKSADNYQGRVNASLNNKAEYMIASFLIAKKYNYLA